MSAADDHQTEAPGILLSSKVLQNRYSFSTRRKSNSSSATTSMSLFKEDESTQREMNEGTEATLTLSRTRLPNFSSDETEILLTEVETMFHRRTAGNRDPLALRRSKWQEIADKISAVSGMAREPKHLKKKLNDLRRRVRTRLAKSQADKRTGGAPSPSSRLSRLDERVLAIMPDLARSAVTGVDTLHMQLRSLEEGCSYCLDGSSCWAHDILTGGGKHPGCRMSPVLSLSSDYDTDNQSTSSLDRLMEEGHATPYLLHRQGVTAPKGQSGPGARNMRSHEKDGSALLPRHQTENTIYSIQPQNVSELPEEPVCNAIPGVVYEYQPKYDQYGISGDYYSVDQQRTLGEILTYCQVMYDAIRKLDQKFDQLQAKVTNVQAVHLGPSLLKKKPVVPPSTDVDEVHIQVSPEGNAGLTMPQQIQTCPPFFQHQVGAEQPDIVSPAPSVHSPSLVLPFQSPNQHSVHLHSIVSTDFTAQDPEPCHSIGEASRDHLLEEADVKARHKTKQVGQPSRRSCTSPELIGDPGRKVTIPTNVLQKLSQKTNPRNTVRFLLRALFSIETLTCSNVMGDVGRGLSKLDPNKIAAMREWLVERFPSYDLREKGRDWRACISIINSAVRQMRFEARKLRKLQMNSTGQANPPGETPHNEKDEQREGDRTEEQPLGMVEAAEICVELESDSEEEYSSLPVLESPKLFSEESVEYLGNPMRGVRVAHSVMLAARQKRKPESAARFLIRHIFPDRVLLKSNVHGSKERGIPALDFSKISALREFLKEQFPEFKLNEDGYDWKVCVIAMNATIRRFRYDLQKFKRMTRADSR